MLFRCALVCLACWLVASSLALGESPDTVQEITFDTLALNVKKASDYDAAKHLTEPVKGLAGKQVRVRGNIMPGFQVEGIEQFVLERDNLREYGKRDVLQHELILVKMAAGTTTRFSTKPVIVEGTFQLREFKTPEGKILAIYAIDDGRVVPKAK